MTNYDRNVILLTKDILRQDYISHYNPDAIIKTPNIDSLAENGTKFDKHYCNAPSSGMATTCMFSGLPAHELERKSFRQVDDFTQSTTLFNDLETLGVSTHVLWSAEFEHLAYVYSKVFDDATKIHYAPAGGVTEPTPQKRAFKTTGNKYDLADYFFQHISNIEKNSDGLWFIWCHCPHIFQPAPSYGSDLDIFDALVGRLSKEVDADLIISGDHAHMRGEKGKIVYGFDVYEPEIHLPLICPNWFGKKVITHLTEQRQLKDIILHKKLEKYKFIYSDTQYYEQPDRKLMIRKGRYKLIFNKHSRSEEFYDVEFDPAENINLLIEIWPDYDRNSGYHLDEIIHYPNWDEAKFAYLELLDERKRIWRQGKWIIELAHKLNRIKQRGVLGLFKRRPRERIRKGRWGSRARHP